MRREHATLRRQPQSERQTPQGASHRHRNAIAAALLCVVFAAICGADETPRATGFRPPPYRMKITKAASAKNSAKRLKATPLPSSWDSREKGWVTPVKYQGPLLTCWTFAANAVIETQLLRAGRGEWDLSEKNMASLCGFEYVLECGGDYIMASAYLTRWGGAIAEANDVYRYSVSEWNANPSQPFDPALHIQNVLCIPGRADISDNATLKTAIMKYGAAGVPMCFDESFLNSNGAYYKSYVDWIHDGHAVAVIGWDDNYPVTNFLSNCRPSSAGAWIAKNSWGDSYGDDGYIYISYCDKSCAMGEDNSYVFIPATEEENYSAVYGYDKLGPIYDFGEAFGSYNLQAAVFTSAWNETLAAVGVWSAIDGNPYRITIYTNVTRNADSPIENGIVASTQTGTLPHAGFSTIPLPTAVPLADRTNFTVVYEQTGSSFSHWADCRWDGYAEADHPAGCTYLGGVKDGKTQWYDMAELDIAYYSGYKCHAPAALCLKAYTRTTVAAKAGDAPGETADGTQALADLAATNAFAYAQHGETFGAFANVVGANGRTLWANWLTGLDPANPDDDFTLSIAVTNGVPSLSWTPDLGAARTYTILGCRDLPPAGGWIVVPKAELPTTTNRFFKVTVGN